MNQALIAARKLRSGSQFTVVGAGVIGLLTARELARRGHRVRILAKEGRPGAYTSSTSAAAVGQFLPWLPEGHENDLPTEAVGGMDSLVDCGRKLYGEMAHNSRLTGVSAVRNVELLTERGDWPAGLPAAMLVEATPLASPIGVPGPAESGSDLMVTRQYVFDTYSINTPKTLRFLASEAALGGVEFQRKDISPDELADIGGVVINAAGDGIKALTSQPGISYFKGHSITIKPERGYLPQQALSVDDLIIMPREDGTVIIGAPYYPPQGSTPIPQKNEAAELVRRIDLLCTRAHHLVAGLRPDLMARSKVLYHTAGYRVSFDETGIYVGPDSLARNVLHANGFIGIGWSAGPAYAKHIADQAERLRTVNHVAG